MAPLRYVMLLLLAGTSRTWATAGTGLNQTTWCSSAGIFCLGCDHVGVCVETSPGEFREFVVEDCPQDAPCSESLKQCSGVKKSWCSRPDGGDTLLCQGPGEWPDPFDCNVFWTCGDTGLSAEDYLPDARNVCPAGTAFDPLTSQCSLSSGEAECGEDQYPLPPCDAQTVSAAPSARDPNLYYVCVGGVVRLYRCQGGYEFDGEAWACVKGNGTEPTTSSPGFQCPGVGRFPDLESCFRYYDCSDVAHPRLAACPWSQYFHREKLTCKTGSCPYQ